MNPNMTDKFFDIRDLKNKNGWTTVRILPEDAITTQFYATHGTHTTRVKKLTNGTVIDVDAIVNKILKDNQMNSKVIYPLIVGEDDIVTAYERISNITAMMRMWGEYTQGTNTLEEHLFKCILPNSNQLTLLVAYDIVVLGYQDAVWTLECPSAWGDASDLIHRTASVNWDAKTMFIEAMEFVNDYADDSDDEN